MAPRFSNFAFELRRIVARQPLPGYRLAIRRLRGGREALTFAVEDPSVGARLAARLDALSFAEEPL